MYKDKEKHKEASKEAMKRYRERNKGITKGMTKEGITKGITRQTERYYSDEEIVELERTLPRGKWNLLELSSIPVELKDTVDGLKRKNEWNEKYCQECRRPVTTSYNGKCGNCGLEWGGGIISKKVE